MTLTELVAKWPSVPPPPGRFASARVSQSLMTIAPDASSILQVTVLDADSSPFFYWWTSSDGWAALPIGARTWSD